jgi:hypothetical protein
LLASSHADRSTPNPTTSSSTAPVIGSKPIITMRILFLMLGTLYKGMFGAEVSTPAVDGFNNKAPDGQKRSSSSLRCTGYLITNLYGSIQLDWEPKKILYLLYLFFILVTRVL